MNDTSLRVFVVVTSVALGTDPSEVILRIASLGPPIPDRSTIEIPLNSSVSITAEAIVAGRTRDAVSLRVACDDFEEAELILSLDLLGDTLVLIAQA